jgi:hypothetical protein
MSSDAEPEVGPAAGPVGPHPDLVAVMRPTTAEVCEAILTLGLFAPDPAFYPVVPAAGPRL